VAELPAFVLLGAFFIFWPANFVTDGQLVEATVVRVGTYAAGRSRGGDLPILTVRLPNGSIRQVRASWSTAGDCIPGGRISLLQRATALQVSLRGCRRAPPSG